MLKNLTIILVFVFIIILFFYFKKDESITNLDSPNQTIVFFGDSLVSGVGSTPGNDLASLISKEIGEPIINLGVSGNTSAMGLERISEVIDQNPRLVFVLFGGNDFLGKVPIETTFQNIDEMVVLLQNAGSAVVLLGIKGGILNDSYAERFKEIAKNRNTIYVPNVLQGLVGDSTLMSDAIHPNDTGYKLISEKIMKEVWDNF